MYLIVRSLLFVLVFVSAAFSQEISREQKIEAIDRLRSQISALEKEVLQPSANDLSAARGQGFAVIRLMPREKYENVLSMRGGGAYYSFALKSQEYGGGSDIELQRDHISVGFAGGDYGLIFDLGSQALTEVSKESPELNFLLNYVPPSDRPLIRVEQRRSASYEANGFTYKSHFPAVVGHTYALRSIQFGRYDILVAFSITRKDTDGSLIIMWKPIETFAKPEISRDSRSE